MASISAASGSALDLGANGIEAFRGGRGTDRDQAAGGFGKAPERRLGKADFVGADQTVFVGDQQRREQAFESSRNSTRLNPRKTSGRKAFECREITTTFSRPVSRLTRRTFSCGRAGSAVLILIFIRHDCAASALIEIKAQGLTRGGWQ